MHDVIAATVHQCRRLIIILSPEGKFSTHGNKEEELLCLGQNQPCYEQKIVLHDALTQNDPKVILLEVGEDRIHDYVMRMHFDTSSAALLCFRRNILHYSLYREKLFFFFWKVKSKKFNLTEQTKLIWDEIYFGPNLFCYFLWFIERISQFHYNKAESKMCSAWTDQYGENTDADSGPK